MKVTLKSVGNPDFGENPNESVWGCEDNKEVTVNSFKEASKVCSKFIEENDLGSGNWAGGQIKDDSGKVIAFVSYNGRVWEGAEYTEHNIEIKIK